MPRAAARILTAFVCLSLASCNVRSVGNSPNMLSPTASGPAGTLIVYRPKGTLGTRGESPFVTIGGRSYGSIKAGTFIRAEVEEGKVDVTLQQSTLLIIPTIPRTVTVEVVEGTTSYVRADQNITSADSTDGFAINQSINLVEVSVEEGQADTAGLSQAN